MSENERQTLTVDQAESSKRTVICTNIKGWRVTSLSNIISALLFQDFCRRRRQHDVTDTLALVNCNICLYYLPIHKKITTLCLTNNGLVCEFIVIRYDNYLLSSILLLLIRNAFISIEHKQVNYLYHIPSFINTDFYPTFKFNENYIVFWTVN